MLSSRLKPVMNSLISPSQSAFVPKRVIGDNIMLAQALCRDYHLNKGQPRCAIKLDIHKAFDSLNWDFLFKALQAMGFPQVFINWIHGCITTCMLSVKINGGLEGFFKAKSGLRQGDPLSPYLFVLSMEVLTACIAKSTATGNFSYHPQASNVELTHLIFADDVFLFCRADQPSITAIFEGITLFSSISGLQPSNSKSTCFFCNVPVEDMNFATELTGFQRGQLPIKYLGLPLISKRLTNSDCMPLVLRITERMAN